MEKKVGGGLHNTFGSEQDYKMLNCVHNNLILLPKNRKNYLGKILSDLSETCTKISKIEDNRIVTYASIAHKNDYKEKLKGLNYRLRYVDKVDMDINVFITHLENFISAKIKNIQKERLSK